MNQGMSMTSSAAHLQLLAVQRLREPSSAEQHTPLTGMPSSAQSLPHKADADTPASYRLEAATAASAAWQAHEAARLGGPAVLPAQPGRHRQLPGRRSCWTWLAGCKIPSPVQACLHWGHSVLGCCLTHLPVAAFFVGSRLHGRGALNDCSEMYGCHWELQVARILLWQITH